MDDELMKVAPEICSYVDDDHTKLTLEISVPGVKKEAITLKMHEDSFSLSAPRSDLVYTAAHTFCCPVNPDKAEAHYENGLLKVVLPFKDIMEDAVKVKIS